MGKMFFNILATADEFETDLLRLRTREGMAVARGKGKLKGKQPKLTPRQQTELTRMHATGEYTIADLMEAFSVGRPGCLGGALYALDPVPGIVVDLPEQLFVGLRYPGHGVP
jgi:hypothetical protein